MHARNFLETNNIGRDKFDILAQKSRTVEPTFMHHIRWRKITHIGAHHNDLFPLAIRKRNGLPVQKITGHINKIKQKCEERQKQKRRSHSLPYTLHMRGA